MTTLSLCALAAAGVIGITALAAVPAQAADVGVSIGISQPGVYGRIDIGRFPQPLVIVQQPVVVQRYYREPRAVPEPVYLWVPPGHQRDWRHNCQRYSACGVPVYFVQDRWYREQGPGSGYQQGRRDERRDDRHDDRRDDRHDERHDRGNGHGNGHGHGNGRGNGHD